MMKFENLSQEQLAAALTYGLPPFEPIKDDDGREAVDNEETRVSGAEQAEIISK